MSEFLAEVIAIGDEMTSGAKLDTNTQWLCQRLSELGVTVRFTSMVGDDLDANIDVFRHAANRVDFVVSTGGLGPTADDLTRESLAAVADKPLVLHQPSLTHIESLFASRARDMPPRNRVQAMFPEGALDVFNQRGTAPGIDLTVPRASGGSCRIFALPGVPAEMKEMFSDIVAPRILDNIGGDRQLIRNAVIKCFGLGESEMEARLGEMIARQSYPRVGITVSAATISLRITAMGHSEEFCSAAIEQTRQEIHSKAGEFVFGEGEEFELQNAVAEILDRRNECIAIIEVGHAAPLSHWFADVLEQKVFAGGRVFREFTYTAETLENTRAEFGADWLVVVDRYFSLRNQTAEPAEVNISVVGPTAETSVTKSYRLGGHPSIVHPRIGKAALALVRSHLLTLENASITQHQGSPS